MIRLLPFLLAAACATPPAPPDAADVPFARTYLARAETAASAAGPRREPGAPTKRAEPGDPAADLRPVPAARLAELRDADPGRARTRADLEAFAWLRAPELRAARDRLAAARTKFLQAEDLADLVAMYRSFVREMRTRVGPERSGRPAARIAPFPNVDALAGEIAAREIAMAEERVRAAALDVVADARRAHADAVRLAEARRILAADVALHEALVAVVRARFEAGTTPQSGLLAFQARLADLRTTLADLDEERAAVRARWNRLLDRPEDAPVDLDVAGPDTPPAPPDADAAVAAALAHAPPVRLAELDAERIALAVRMAETMTLPRFDAGSSRFERERSKDAFPPPGRMVMPAFDFGLREAQVQDLRHRADAARHAATAAGREAAAVARGAAVTVDAARRRWLVHENELVPLARSAFDSARAAYEAGGGYLELLDGARLLLGRRLGRADARRAHARAEAALLRAAGTKEVLR